MNNNNGIWYKRYTCWLVLLLYSIVLWISISRHELWGDEVHSWNIAKASLSFGDLISNTRYEGHPPLWYVLLFVLSKFTHNPACMQFLQFGICVFSAFILLFRFRLSLIYKALMLFGYYFLYEYGAFSRNYAIGIFLSFLCCLSMDKKSENVLPYYLYLFLLSNTHFLALILAFSLHVYFLSQFTEKGKIAVNLAIGLLLLCVSLYFVFPPSNSGLNTSFWLKLWNKDQFFIVIQAPLKALCPISAWWEYNFWNTQALLQLQKSYSFLKFINPLVSAALLASCLYVLRSNKKSLLFFSLNLILILGFALVFPLTTLRYVGFIFIGFILALLLAKDTLSLNGSKRIVLYGLLILQLAGAFVALKKDWEFPFSHGNNVPKISSVIPSGESVITDYWCLNYYSAFVDKPVYCLGFNKEKSYLLWDKEMTIISQQNDIYTHGTKMYLTEKKTDHVYFMTNTPKSDIEGRDSLFFKTFDVQLLADRANAIEKYSNIYVYKVSLRK